MKIGENEIEISGSLSQKQLRERIHVISSLMEACSKDDNIKYTVVDDNGKTTTKEHLIN